MTYSHKNFHEVRRGSWTKCHKFHPDAQAGCKQVGYTGSFIYRALLHSSPSSNSGQFPAVDTFIPPHAVPISEMVFNINISPSNSDGLHLLRAMICYQQHRYFGFDYLVQREGLYRVLHRYWVVQKFSSTLFFVDLMASENAELLVSLYM